MEPLEARQLLAADPIINEFVALNTTLQDADGDFSDWIEFQNRGDMTADLSGYYVTNDAGHLTKWQFPTTSLGVGEYLIVYASGKDRGGEELHTNFTIDELGGDLAFVAPDGSTIVSNFLGHPALGANRSYGLFTPTGDAELVGETSDVAVLIPNDNSLGNTWTTPGFDDASWIQGTGSVGFDARGSATDFTVEVYYSTSQISSLAAADNAIAGNNLKAGSPHVEQHQVVNFLDTRDDGHYGDSVEFPGASGGDNNDFVMRATTTFFLKSNQAGDWTFGVNTDEGSRLRIDGLDVIVDDSLHAAADRLATVSDGWLHPSACAVVCATKVVRHSPARHADHAALPRNGF